MTTNRHLPGAGRGRAILKSALAVAALAGSGVATAGDPPGFAVLHAFTGGRDGAVPVGGLLLASDGELYGTSSWGGEGGGGTLFRVTRHGHFKVAATFSGIPYSSTGTSPQASLIEGADGALYGTTPYGGIDDAGTVFRYTALTGVTLVHAFHGPWDGSRSTGPLVQGPDGALYGGTQWGGGPNGYGTVYRVRADGREEVLHAFPPPGSAAPEWIVGGLTLGRDGGLFGVSSGGGADGLGAAFKIDPEGGAVTELASFAFALGSDPAAPLLLGADGDFYGTTRQLYDMRGTVFRMTAAGKIHVLHVFTNGEDGSTPYGGLVQDARGNLYGVTAFGGEGPCADYMGDSGCGTVFRIAPDGRFTTLYRFTGGPDGGVPLGTLAIDAKGRLYGTASAGGLYGFGTVFAFDPRRLP